MGFEHRFWEIVNKRERISNDERCLITAIINLSVTVYTHLTFEEIYDELLYRRSCASSFTAGIAVKEQLNRMEETLEMVQKTTQRLQDDSAAMTVMLTKLQQSATDVQTALDAGNKRLEDDIAALRNTAGSGDTDALNAIADSMEATLKGHQALSDQLEGIATAENQVDVAPPPTTLTISPVTVTLDRAGTQQFTANLPGATFKATSGGTIDTAGNYIPPTDTTVTSDTVIATSADGTQNASANVSITDAAPAQPATQGMKQ